MKLTSTQLRMIIKEEVSRVLSESSTSDAVRKAIAKYKTDPRLWTRVVDEFRAMASGNDVDGVRDEYYPGWSDEDFQAVIDTVQEYRRSSITKR